MPDQPATTTLTRAGLEALYRELGEKTHLVHELMAQLSAARATVAEQQRRIEDLEGGSPEPPEQNGTTPRAFPSLAHALGNQEG